MNSKAIEKTRNGFKYDETLASNLKFSGHIRVWEVTHAQKMLPDGDVFDYWTVKDEYGARLGTIDKKLAESLVIAERYVVEGEVKIGKGGTFLNLKNASPLNGKDFTPID